MNEPKTVKFPVGLKVANVAFIVLWSFVAVFPLFWVFVMSVKLPLDAFAHNPLQVLFGYETLQEGKGLSLSDLAVWCLAIWWVYRLTKTRSYDMVDYLNRNSTGTVRGWLIFVVLYILALVVVLGFGVGAFAQVLRSVLDFVPLLDVLSIPLLGFTGEHYYAVWIENAFYDNFINSAIITAGVVTVSLSVGTLAGYALSRTNSNLAFWLLLTALIFRALPHSVLVTGYIPAFMNSQDIFQPLWDFWGTGWLFGLFADEAPTLYGMKLPVIVVLVAINQPFTIWMLRSFFANIPSELDEAARVDGCSHITAFVRVIMPVMWPGVITTGLFSFLLAYNDYLVTSLLLDAQSQTMVPSISQYFNRETTATDQMEAIAAATSIILPLFFLVMVFQKQIVSGLTQGAVK